WDRDMPKQAQAKRSLLEGLLARFSTRKEPPAAGPMRPFQAISIYRGLAGCNMRKTCQCKYIKHRDRRSEPRRLIDFGVVARLFDGNERRARRAGRRTSD